MQLHIVVLSLLMFSYVSSRVLPSIPKNTRNRMRLGNCTEAGKRSMKCRTIKEIIEINKIKNKLIRTLSKKTDENGSLINPYTLTSKTKRPVEKGLTTPKPVSPEFKEIISLSEKAVNKKEKNILQFNINANNNGGPLEPVSAHLWIKIKRRRRSKGMKRFRKARRKKIVLQVSRIHINDSSVDSLTKIRTHVKKTRLQRITLPVTLIQNILDTPNKTLKLRIECIKCGRGIRPVLSRRKSKRRKNKRRKKSDKPRRFKRKKGNDSDNYRSQKLKRKQQMAPFLVVRYLPRTFQRKRLSS